MYGRVSHHNSSVVLNLMGYRERRFAFLTQIAVYQSQRTTSNLGNIKKSCNRNRREQRSLFLTNSVSLSALHFLEPFFRVREDSRGFAEGYMQNRCHHFFFELASGRWGWRDFSERRDLSRFDISLFLLSVSKTVSHIATARLPIAGSCVA